mgnify:CR=1 FL=1
MPQEVQSDACSDCIIRIFWAFELGTDEIKIQRGAETQFIRESLDCFSPLTRCVLIFGSQLIEDEILCVASASFLFMQLPEFK